MRSSLLLNNDTPTKEAVVMRLNSVRNIHNNLFNQSIAQFTFIMMNCLTAKPVMARSRIQFALMLIINIFYNDKLQALTRNILK